MNEQPKDGSSWQSVIIEDLMNHSKFILANMVHDKMTTEEINSYILQLREDGY